MGPSATPCWSFRRLQDSACHRLSVLRPANKQQQQQEHTNAQRDSEHHNRAGAPPAELGAVAATVTARVNVTEVQCKKACWHTQRGDVWVIPAAQHHVLGLDIKQCGYAAARGASTGPPWQDGGGALQPAAAAVLSKPASGEPQRPSQHLVAQALLCVYAAGKLHNAATATRASEGCLQEPARPPEHSQAPRLVSRPHDVAVGVRGKAAHAAAEGVLHKHLQGQQQDPTQMSACRCQPACREFCPLSIALGTESIYALEPDTGDARAAGLRL